MNPTKSIFLVKNSHFSIATGICSSYSLLKTYLTCSPYSSSVIEQMIISSRYAITYSSRCSPSTLLIRFQNVAGAFISPNCITNGLYSLSFNLNTAFYLSPSLILIWWYAYLRSIFVKICALPILSQISLIKGKGYLSFLIMLFNYLQLIYNLSAILFQYKQY